MFLTCSFLPFCSFFLWFAKERPRPLWSFAKFLGRSSFATPLIGFGAHGVRPHIHPAVRVGVPYWHSVCDGSHVLFVLGQHFRIAVIKKVGISVTIAIDPLFEIIRPKVAINSCTSSVPSPTTMGADPTSAFSFGVQSPTTSLKRVSFAQPPLGSPQGEGLQLKEDDDMTNLLSPGVKFLPNWSRGLTKTSRKQYSDN